MGTNSSRARTRGQSRSSVETEVRDQIAMLTQADALDWLQELPDRSVDLIVTDPPYESIEKHRAVGTTTRLTHSKASSNDWFAVFPNTRFGELFANLHRVLKNNRHFYLFCDQETMFIAKPLAEQAGFRFWKPLVWDKMKRGEGEEFPVARKTGRWPKERGLAAVSTKRVAGKMKAGRHARAS